MSRFTIFIFIIFCFIFKTNAQLIEKELSDNWFFKNSIENQWYNAKIPGCVHTDLFFNKLIPDPFYADNEKQLRFIELNDYVYKCLFDVDSEIISKEKISLVFEGLDTYADVFLNNHLILKADNMFREWEIECKEYLKPTKNELFIKFHPAVKHDLQKENESQLKLPDSRAYSRKAPYQYGWDWGPRFVSCGIWKTVKIKAWDKLNVESLYFIQKNIDKNKAELQCELEINSLKNEIITIHISDTLSKKILLSQKSELVKGKNIIKLSFSIAKPELWFPNRMGKAYLYNLKTDIYRKSINVFQKVKTIGLRKIELITEKDSVGESFYFKINGFPLFIKGANYIPSNSFPASVTKQTYEDLLNDAVSSNFNMLRVWGGGIYENDIFYDLCDKKGILIWQDFMFACTMYPADSSFTASVKQEATDNVKRLRNHACIALWCGNNEVDEGWHNWGWQKQLAYTATDSAKIWNDYLKIFQEVLPEVVKKYNASTSYISTSPRKGWGRKESMTEGDSHYWGVWWGKEPFEKYIEKTGRFMSEYGFQAIPEMKTIKAMVDDSCLFLNSTQMRSHQKHPTGFETIDEYMQRDYKKPKDFSSYIYVSQLLQAEGVKTAIEAHRRAMPRCMGTLYWQFNDCWPVTSWSGIDFYGRWKALQYEVKKLYQNVIISQTINNDIVEIWIISDSIETFEANLQLQLMDFNGKSVWEKQIPLKIEANSSKIGFQIHKSELVNPNDTSVLLLNAKLSKNKQFIAESNLYFAKFKNLILPEPQLQQELRNYTEFAAEITLSSPVLIKNLFLESDLDIRYSDNYFDLLPNQPKTIRLFYHHIPKENLLKNIKFKSLYNTY